MRVLAVFSHDGDRVIHVYPGTKENIDKVLSELDDELYLGMDEDDEVDKEDILDLLNEYHEVELYDDNGGVMWNLSLKELETT